MRLCILLAALSCSFAPLGVLGGTCEPEDAAPGLAGNEVAGHQPGIWVASSNLPLNLPEEDDDPTRRGIVLSCAWDDARVLGGNIVVPWSKFDNGPGAGTDRYDWTWVEEQMALWTDRGKKVNLLVWSSAQQAKQHFDGESMTPQWLFDLDVPTVTCNGSPETPVHDNELVRGYFMNALTAFYERYKDHDKVNYFRFGAGVGSENYPINNSMNLGGPCRPDWETASDGDADTWKEHVEFMMNFFGTLQNEDAAYLARNRNAEDDRPEDVRNNAPIVVSLNDYKGVTNGAKLPATIFSAARKRRLGIGCQGPTDRHRRDYESGKKGSCTANWCQLFDIAKADPRIPVLEVQTPNASGPLGRDPTDGTGPGYTPTGPLQALGPFLLKRGATSFEFYPSEFRIANFRDGNPFYDDFNGVYDDTFACIAERSVENAQGLSSSDNPCPSVSPWEPPS